MEYSSSDTYKAHYLSGRILLALWVAVLLLLTIPGNARAVTVTAHVAYTPSSHQRGKKPDNSNIVIWLTPVPNSTGWEADAQLNALPHHFQLLQSHKRFKPHLLVIPVGSVVDFPNQDPFFHNVFSLFDGKRFDLGLYEAGTTRGLKFDRGGVSFIFCNIHPQMSAVIFAMKTPYYAVSDKSGGVEILGVPSGRYRMEIWSERAPPGILKSLQREITVSGDENSLGMILIKETQDLLAGHKNKYGADYDTTGPSTPVYKQQE